MNAGLLLPRIPTLRLAGELAEGEDKVLAIEGVILGRAITAAWCAEGLLSSLPVVFN